MLTRRDSEPARHAVQARARAGGWIGAHAPPPRSAASSPSPSLRARLRVRPRWLPV